MHNNNNYSLLIVLFLFYFQKKELVDSFGVYVKYIDLEQAEQGSKNSATGLMRALIALWYTRERLAGCSATSGINTSIRTAVFSMYNT